MARAIEFAAGSIALDLTDTISGRGVEEIDLLPTETALGAWLAAAGIVPTRSAMVTAEQLCAVRDLRGAIFRCACAAIAGSVLPAADIGIINWFAALPGFRPQLVGDRIVSEAADPIEAALSFMAADAIAILTPPDRGRLRTCPGCNMLFVDRSRPGRRRWCSSASGCGNRAKVKDFRQRRAAENGEVA